MAGTKRGTKGKKKPNPVVGFSVPPELDAKIERYAAENGFNKSAAMRHMIVVFMREHVNFSNMSSEIVKS